MNYHQELLKIVTTKDYPSFKDSDKLGELEQIADDFLEADNLSGYMSAIVIYHQLTENIIKLLITCSRLWIKLIIAPDKIEFSDIDDKMFGYILNEYKNSIKNEKLIELCKKINKIRINLVHKIVVMDLNEIKEESLLCREYYNEIFEIYEQEYDGYLLRYKEIARYPEDFEEGIEDFI